MCEHPPLDPNLVRIQEARNSESRVREFLYENEPVWDGALKLKRSCVAKFVKSEMGKSQSFAPSSISAIERTLEALEFKLADYPFGYHKYLDQLLLEGIPPLLLRVMIALIHQKILLKLKNEQ